MYFATAVTFQRVKLELEDIKSDSEMNCVSVTMPRIEAVFAATIPPPDTYSFYFPGPKEKKIMFGIIRSTELMRQKTPVEGWLRPGA